MAAKFARDRSVSAKTATPQRQGEQYRSRQPVPYLLLISDSLRNSAKVWIHRRQGARIIPRPPDLLMSAPNRSHGQPPSGSACAAIHEGGGSAFPPVSRGSTPFLR